MNRIEGAIFDMDGTLLDSMPMWEGVADRLLEPYGQRMTPALHQAILPLTLPQSIELVRAHFALPDSVEQLVERAKQLTDEYYFGQCCLKPGAMQFLQALHRRGVPIAVATATDRPRAQGALQHTGVWPLLDGLVTCAEAGAGKQQPTVYHCARRLLGTPVQDTWVFEDTMLAVTTAKAAGYRAAAVADESSRADWPAQQKTADLFVSDWQQAMEFFGLE